MFVRVFGYTDSQYSVQAYNPADPADLEVLVKHFLSNRLLDEAMTGDFLTDLKRAYVIAEQQCSEILKENARIREDNIALREQLNTKQEKAAELSEKLSKAGKEGGRGRCK